MNKNKSFDKAFEELKRIASDLQDENAGIDTLSKKLSKAKELMAFCKNKLRDIESQVDDQLSSVEEE